MSIPFVPLTILFIIALVILLVGLRLSSRTLATNQRKIEEAYHRRNVAQRYSTRKVSAYGSADPYPMRFKGAGSYRSSVDYMIPRRAQRTYVKSQPASEIGISLMDLIAYVRRELINNPLGGKYSLRTALRKYSKWLVLILALGLVFVGSLYYLYCTIPQLYIFSTSMSSYATKPDTASVQLPQGFAGASKALKRLAQLDPSQYSSEQEYSVWAASACSTTAMTEVINAYGHNYHISDILHAEISQSMISPEEGLLNLNGIDRTVAQFGFSTAQLSKAPLDSLISVANNGWPVIADFPPGGDWPTGHFVVVTGGNSNVVFLADSSPYDFTSMTRQQFLQDWGGFAVVVMPKGQ